MQGANGNRVGHMGPMGRESWGVRRGLRMEDGKVEVDGTNQTEATHQTGGPRNDRMCAEHSLTA